MSPANPAAAEGADGATQRFGTNGGGGIGGAAASGASGSGSPNADHCSSSSCSRLEAKDAAVAAGTDTLRTAFRDALRREFLCLWADADPGSLSVELVDSIVGAVLPGLLEHLLAATSRSLPVLLQGVTADSPLPQSVDRSYLGAANGPDAEDLFDELRCALGSHDLLAEQPDARTALKRDVSMRLQMSHPWQRWLCGGRPLVLAMGSMLSLCGAVTPVLLAAASIARSSPGTKHQQPAEESSPHGAVDASAAKRYRRRIFALERELIAREKAERQRCEQERAERDQGAQRLMEINKQMEERLKARTDELKRAGQKIVEAQRNVDETRGLLAVKKKEVTRLQYRLEQDMGDQKSIEHREQEHHRALLRAAARESIGRQRTQKQIECLRRCAEGGEDAADLLQEPAVDEEQTSLFIEQIEADFDAQCQRRREMNDAAAREFDSRIERKRLQYREACGKLRDLKPAYRY